METKGKQEEDEGRQTETVWKDINYTIKMITMITLKSQPKMVGRGDKWRQTINLSGAHLLHHIQDRISGRCTGFKGRVQSGAYFRKISLYNIIYISPKSLTPRSQNDRFGEGVHMFS